MLKDRIFGVNLLSEYVFKFKNLLVMQNFKIVFNSIGDIIPLSEKWVAMTRDGQDHHLLVTFKIRSSKKCDLEDQITQTQ